MQPDSEQGRTEPAGEAERFQARLAELLAGGERVALCTILQLVGSGPRSAGAKLLLRDSGDPAGTVGGGLLEARATAWCREILATGGAVCRPFVLTDAEAGGDGMTCGGRMEVLVERLEGNRGEVADFFAQVRSLLVAGGQGCLVVGLRRDSHAVVTARALVKGGRLVAALPAEGCPIPEEILQTFPHAPVLIECGEIRYFLEPLAPPVTMIICGAGHIAAQLVPLCSPLGFRTVVVDDRAEFVNPTRFPLANQLVVAPSLDRALDGLDLGPDTYVVVVTRGHVGDLAVVRQALRGQPGYIGMVGSQRKRKTVFEALARDGCSSDDLSRVVCPIGVPIEAETPEEIAISIVAQLIATRAARFSKS